MKNTSKLLNESNDAVLSAIYFRYNRFKDNVIEDDLIVVETLEKKFYRGSNMSTTPYLEDTILVMTSTVNESHSLTQQFTIDESMFFSNIPLGFIGAQIDFGDGIGYRPTTVGQELNITYPEYGKYIIKLRQTDNNGEMLYAQTYIEIEPEMSGMAPPPPLGYAEVVPLEGYSGNVEIWQFKNELCGDEGIRKALIMLDGFDADDKYDEDFIEFLLEDGLENSLGAILYPEEYDIFYINYPNSTADIFWQAANVRDAIEYINSQKVEDADENVVVGFSMGGIVGKMALRIMELEGVDHETRFYIGRHGARI